jgi:hypothetical protein
MLFAELICAKSTIQKVAGFLDEVTQQNSDGSDRASDNHGQSRSFAV